MATIRKVIESKRESSIIDLIEWRPGDELLIQFKGGNDQYIYSNVAKSLFEDICNAPSIGQAFIINVAMKLDQHPYEIKKQGR